MRTIHAALLLLASGATATGQQPNVATFASQPFVVADGERLHAFTATTSGGTNTTFHQLSRDTGRSWSQPVLVASHPYQTIQPYGIGYAADVDLVGMLFGTSNGPTWVRSLDGGVSWSVGVPIRPAATATLGGSLRHAAGVLVAVWTEHRTTTGEVYCSRSVDFGTTWSPEVRLDPVTVGITNNVIPRLSGNASALHATWSAGANFDGYLQVSTDLGLTWLPTARPMPVGTFSTCFAAEGPVALAQCAATIHRSADYGATWTAVSPPMFVTGGTALAIDGNHVLGAYGGNNAYFPYWPEARTIASIDAGLTWSAPSVNLLPSPQHYPLRLQLALHGNGAAIMVHSMWGLSQPSTVFLVTGSLGQTWTAQPTPGAQFGGVLQVDGGFFATYTNYVTNSATLLTGFQPYGPATPGSGAIAPTLDHAGTPCLGASVSLTIGNALGGAPAVLAASFAGPDLRLFGSTTILIADPVVPTWLFTSGPVGTPGAGSASLAFAIPNAAAFAGLRINLQGFVLDNGAIDGFSATRALEMWVQ